jgi:SHS2 domain-containing protein
MFELIPHTADVRARVTAASLEELFRDAVYALNAAMHAQGGATRVQRTISVHDSADRTALLVDFLNEVLHRAHVGAERFEEVTFTRLDEHSVGAELTGFTPASFDEDVKAVTYHEAEVRLEEETWTTMLVFDI